MRVPTMRFEPPTKMTTTKPQMKAAPVLASGPGRVARGQKAGDHLHDQRSLPVRPAKYEISR